MSDTPEYVTVQHHWPNGQPMRPVVMIRNPLGSDPEFMARHWPDGIPADLLEGDAYDEMEDDGVAHISGPRHFHHSERDPYGDARAE